MRSRENSVGTRISAAVFEVVVAEQSFKQCGQLQRAQFAGIGKGFGNFIRFENSSRLSGHTEPDCSAGIAAPDQLPSVGLERLCEAVTTHPERGIGKSELSAKSSSSQTCSGFNTHCVAAVRGGLEFRKRSANKFSGAGHSRWQQQQATQSEAPDSDCCGPEQSWAGRPGLWEHRSGVAES